MCVIKKLIARKEHEDVYIRVKKCILREKNGCNYHNLTIYSHFQCQLYIYFLYNYYIHIIII